MSLRVTRTGIVARFKAFRWSPLATILTVGITEQKKDSRVSGAWLQVAGGTVHLGPIGVILFAHTVSTRYHREPGYRHKRLFR